MKALSIKQPWANMILTGFKDIEYRSWPTSFRGRVIVHAGQRYDFTAPGDYQPLPRGALLGEVDIIDCVTDSPSPRFSRPYGLVLANPIIYPSPIPYKGRLGFFEVDPGP